MVNCAPTDFLKQANNFDCRVFLRLFVFALCSGTEFSYHPTQSEIKNRIGEALEKNNKKAFLLSAQFNAKLIRPANATQFHINPARLGRKKNFKNMFNKFLFNFQSSPEYLQISQLYVLFPMRPNHLYSR